MKPPVVHQPVQPPQPIGGREPQNAEDGNRPAHGAAADDRREPLDESKESPAPGLVGDYGPIVDASSPARDGAADDEREKP